MKKTLSIILGIFIFLGTMSPLTILAGALEEGVSDWVLEGEVPEDASIVDSKWVYTLTQKTESSSSSLSGWTLYDTKITSYGPEQGPVYSDPSGYNRNVRSESYIADNITHYVFYHRYSNNQWSNDQYASSWARHPGPDVTSLVNGYYSNTTGQRYKASACSKCGATNQWLIDYTYNEPIYGTRWYYKDPVYTYYFTKIEYGLESTTEIKPEDATGTDVISDVKKYVKYSFESSNTENDNSTLNFILNDDGNSYSVTFGDNNNVEKVVIPGTYNGLPVTGIDDSAFYDCTNLTSITISDSVTTIGEAAFINCTSLTSITIPDSVTSVGDYAFNGCTSLNSITISDNVNKIGAYAFENTEYYNNTSNWTDDVLYIGNHFIGVNSSFMGDCVIKAGTKTISPYAFTNSSYVFSVTIPDSVIDIGDYAFYGCSNVISINVNSNNPNYCSLDGVLFNKDKTTLIKYAPGKENTEYSIPSTVTTIGAHAFEDSMCLVSVEISNCVTDINDYAFNWCMNLARITISDNVKHIGEDAFAETAYYNDASNWQNYVLYVGNHIVDADPSIIGGYAPNDGTKTIADKAFAECTNLTSIVLFDGVANIGNHAFWSCSNLNTVILAESVIDIGDYAFDSCTNLSSISIPGSVTNIGNSAFYGCTSLESVTINDGVKNIGNSVFGFCVNLDSIVIPDSVTSIGASCFSNCSNLVSVDMPAKLTVINESTFDGCTKLSTIAIPDNVTHIGDAVFQDCSNLDSILIPVGVSAIGRYVFLRCDNLTSIVIPDTVSTIGYGAFEECTNLKYVFCPDTSFLLSTKTIGEYNDLLLNAYWHYGTTEHVEGDWITDTDSTCTEKGTKHTECTVCGLHMNYGSVDEKPHQTQWSVLTNATCTEDGTRVKTCSLCKKQIELETIPAIGHSASNWVVDKEATCTTDGSRSKKCSTCGEVVTETIVANGHTSSSEWTIDVAPTCTTEGSKSHHCTVCGEKTDVMVIEATGHNYVAQSTGADHPHTIAFKCSLCEDIKTETGSALDCIECNFTITTIDSSSYKLVSYIGTYFDVTIPATYNGRAITTISNGCFKGNTTITSVNIADGITSIGSLAFMNCNSLEKVIIPDSVTSIGAQAFYGCTTTIYCTNGSYAHEYAVANNINYVIVSIMETENTVIDYDNFVINTSVENCDDITEIIGVSKTALAIPVASHIGGSVEFYGTGTVITVFDGNEYIGDFTLVVNGDTNGDSVCDALDAAQVALVTNGHKTIEGAYAMAADSNSDDIVDIDDYQAIVNKAVS